MGPLPFWRPWWALRPDCRRNDEITIVKSRDYFVRTMIELPVIGFDEPFSYSVWASVSKDSYER